MAFTKINAAGIGTTERVTVDGLTIINNLSVGGTVSIAGTLTYEDVTNIDAVGLITARDGVFISAGSSIGIGSATPTAPINVHSSSNTLGILSSTDGGANLDLFDDDTQSRIRSVDGRLHLYADFGSSVSDSAIRFFVDGSSNEVARVTSSAVGIGTTNPSAKLETFQEGTRSAGYLFMARAGLDTGRRGYGLFPPASNSVDEPFAWNTGNAHSFEVDSIERLRISSNGNIGIGTSSPAHKLHITVGSAHAIPLKLQRTHNNNCLIHYKNSALDMYAGLAGEGLGWGVGTGVDLGATANSKLMITSSGDVGIGVIAPEKTFHVHGNALIEDTIGNNFEIRSTVNNGNDPNFYFSKARGGGTPAIVQNGDDIGNLQWQGYDGDSYEVGASILGEVDGTPSDGDMPMRLTFKTRSAGAGSEQGRLRIHADGLVSLENNSNLQIPDKIIHSGDVNTAIRFPADDTVSVETVGSERLRITSDGNVGINFTAPTAKLEVSASNQAGLRIIDSHTNQAAPYIEVIGKRTDTNNSQSFGGQIFLAGNVTDAKVHSGKTLGAVLFGGNHTDGSLSNIAYPASIAAVASDSFDSVTDMPTDLIFLTGVTGRTPTTANVASGSERLRITSSGDVLIGGTAEITDVKVRVVGNMAQSNEDTGTGATMKTYVLSRSYTMSTSGTNVLTFDNWGTSAFDISVFRRDNQSPAGAQLSKVYLAFHGSGTNITQATLAQENKVIRGSIHSISYSISENNNTATLTATGDDNGGETQDLTFYILARGNALGQIVVA